MNSIAKWHDTFVNQMQSLQKDFFQANPGVKPIAEDGLSSGKNSWMSMSNASFLSMDLSMVENGRLFCQQPIGDQNLLLCRHSGTSESQTKSEQNV
jgi:hypothetical protein